MPVPTLHMFLLLVLVLVEHYLGQQGHQISLLLSTFGALWAGPSYQLRMLMIYHASWAEFGTISLRRTSVTSVIRCQAE